jgi:acyl-[acyl-carrier-protein] desaturase
MKKYNQVFDFDVHKKNIEILKALEEDAKEIFNAHLNSRKDWYPHEMIPWNRYSNIEKYGFEYNKENISENISSAIYLLLMTEDNLPWYARTITGFIGPENRHTIWNTWLQQWTAEEDRHSFVIRNYVTLNGLIDPFYLEDARMHQISSGLVPEGESPIVTQWLTYTTLQELAGRVSYRRVAIALSEDTDGYHIMSKVASDENRHFIFYRDICKKGFEKHPSEFLIGLAMEGINFQLPGNHSGQGMIDFDKHSRNMANGGFYNLDLYINQVLKPTVEFWKIDQLKDLTPEAEKAREDIFSYIDKTNKFIEKIKDRALRSSSADEISQLNKITHLPSLFESKNL